MAFPFTGNLFPNTDYNKINLDWILDEMKQDREDIDEIKQELENISADIPDYSIENIKLADGSIDMRTLSAEVKARLGDYVTPEMYGAVGDGTTDDSTAIQDAVDSGKPILMTRKYLMASPVTIANNKCILCFGEIVVDTDINYFIVTGTSNYIFVNRAIGLHSSVDSDSVWTFNGTLFYLYGDATTVSYNTITVKRCENVKYMIKCNGTNNHGVMYNFINFAYSLCEYTFYATASNGGWCNNNFLQGNRARGNYGVYFEKGTGQTDNFNGNIVYNVGFEGIQCAIRLEFAYANKFINIRTSESLNGTYWVDIASDSYGNYLNSIALTIDTVNDLNSNVNPNVYDVSTFKFKYNGADVVCGYGGKVYHSQCGWTVDRVAPPKRKISISGDGNVKTLPGFGLYSGWFVNVSSRDNGNAIISIPANSGYGYGNGAEIVYYTIPTGAYPCYLRYGSSNMPGGVIATTDSGYYKAQYVNNTGWVVTKMADL